MQSVAFSSAGQDVSLVFHGDLLVIHSATTLLALVLLSRRQDRPLALRGGTEKGPDSFLSRVTPGTGTLEATIGEQVLSLGSWEVELVDVANGEFGVCWDVEEGADIDSVFLEVEETVG